jgi:hypothetical protein
VFEHFAKTPPGFATVLTAPVVPFEHDSPNCPVVPSQTDKVADHSIVIVVALELGVEGTKESSKRYMTILLAPLGKIGQGAV